MAHYLFGYGQNQNNNIMNSTEEFEQLSQRVKHLESKVNTLESQIEALNGIANERCIKTEQAQHVAATSNSPSATNIPPVCSSTTEVKSTTEFVATNVAPKPRRATDNDVESKIGKNIMSILASILVFCSLVLFGSMIHSVLTPVIKTVLMLTASVAVAAFGLFKMRKESKYKTLFTALAGCGVGAFYISCVVSYFTLHTFNDIALMATIVLWIAALIALCKWYSSKIFTCICFAGIIVATILSFYKWEDNTIIALAIYMVSTTALYIANHSRNYTNDWWMFIQLPIVATVLSFGSYVAAPIMFILPAVLIFQAFFYSFRDNERNLMMFSTVAYLITLKIASNCAETLTMSIFLIIACIAVCYLFYRRFYAERKIIFNTALITTTLLLSISQIDIEAYDNICAVLYPILAIIVGCILRDTIIRTGAYILLLIQATNNSEYLHISDYSFAFVAIALIPWVIKNYHIIDKVAIFAFLIIQTIVLAAKGPVDAATTFSIVGIISIIFNLPCMRRDPVTGKGEEFSTIASRVLNGMMILIGINVVLHCDSAMLFMNNTIASNEVAIAIASCILLGMACVNIRSLMNINSQKDILGLFNCFKLTLVVGVILFHFIDASYVISIVGLLLAIAFIIIGFRQQYKSFRLYGLILSMTCVVKLVLADVQYDSSVMRPVGFLIAGGLCYLISYIYSRIEKNSKDENTKVLSDK